MNETSLKQNNHFLNLLILLACIIGGILLVSLASMALMLGLGIPIGAFENVNQDFYDNINGIKLIQTISQIGMFVIPSIVFASIIAYKPFQWLGFKTKNISGNNWLWGSVLTTALILGALPFLAWVLQWNMQMELPAFLADLENWMRASEEQLAAMTEAFLKMESPTDLIINLLVVAVTPAIAEEMLFRGALQPSLQNIFKNAHIAIILTGIIFSAIHVQFFGFFPRMIIGIYLGYLYFWSGSLWFPILGHFINNGIQVLAIYFGALDLADAANAPEQQVPLIAAIVSLIILTILAFLFKKLFQKTPN